MSGYWSSASALPYGGPESGSGKVGGRRHRRSSKLFGAGDCPEGMVDDGMGGCKPAGGRRRHSVKGGEDNKVLGARRRKGTKKGGEDNKVLGARRRKGTKKGGDGEGGRRRRRHRGGEE